MHYRVSFRYGQALREQRKRYRYEQMMAPNEKLKSLSDAEQFLKPSLSVLLSFQKEDYNNQLF